MVFKKVVVLMMGCLGYSKQPTLPTPTAENGESLTVDLQIRESARIRLSDSRFLANTERGVPKNVSNYRVIVVHGFGSSKEMNFMASQDLLDKLKIYLLLFDRAGYGESDPNPRRSLKTEASDIEELAIGLQILYPGSIIRMLPRLELPQTNAKQVVPYINYKLPNLPSELTKDDYRKWLSCWTIFVARYAPGLMHWWLTQKLFPSSSVLDRNPTFFSKKDLEVLKNTPGDQLLSQMKVLQLFRGREDKVVPVQLQRYVSGKLPWIRYHEVPDGGHLPVYDSEVCEAILTSLLLGPDPPMYRPEHAN
ncbi:hypothetical protein CASFOL_029156 [Castilleja foliolosa]|uniref:AB hydrolase-1 domain-containing protein n=1 Tax=Castilleja foliolosa TaxID=1961234 RepID=A0ABD3CBJ8_9LAMI